jgi:hypothetical protein
LSSGDELYATMLTPQGPAQWGTIGFAPAGSWTTFETQIPADGTTYTEMGIAINVSKDGPTSGSWSATFYIDDVQILP